MSVLRNAAGVATIAFVGGLFALPAACRAIVWIFDIIGGRL